MVDVVEVVLEGKNRECESVFSKCSRHSEGKERGIKREYSWHGWAVWSAWRCRVPSPGHQEGPSGSPSTDWKGKTTGQSFFGSQVDIQSKILKAGTNQISMYVLSSGQLGQMFVFFPLHIT